MANITVVVTFYSRGGATETLAHAAAVGAVQARALIRLRRVEDADPGSILDRLPESRESLRRMHKEYVAPREADVLAADALILASPGDVSASSPEWSTFLDLLARLQSEGKLTGKVVAVIANGAASDSFAAFVRRLGVATPEPDRASAAEDGVSRAVALGRHVVSMAQAMKKAPTA
jgi:multimeric flavodoxin WrbA